MLDGATWSYVELDCDTMEQNREGRRRYKKIPSPFRGRVGWGFINYRPPLNLPLKGGGKERMKGGGRLKKNILVQRILGDKVSSC